jgi:formyltetrahydrofolate deformylase
VHKTSSTEPGCSAVLTLSCPDTTGIVHAVSGFLLAEGGSIVESRQFSDPESGTLFMRVAFEQVHGRELDLTRLREQFSTVADRYSMTWRMVSANEPARVVIMVSREEHCLSELLYRNSVGDLHLDVVAVVSNHTDLRRVAEHFGVPFRHVPVTKEDKSQAEAALLQLVREERVDLVVLARYMQILGDDVCKELEGRMINIHHSMLPSFKGARPYHQAYVHGVKVVGATAHYVTADLDEGPIIEQQVATVDHTMSPAALIARGREVERRALARAVRWHTENRVLLNGRRTVVLQ